MSSLPQGALATERDYLDLAPGGPRYELIEGELRMAPAPNLRHQRVSRNLEFIIHRYLQDHPIGEIFDAPCDVFLSEINVFQPDILYVANERAQILSERGVEGAPDLVVEILSPSSAKQDQGPKKRVYAATGVTEYWIIDPLKDDVVVYFPRQNADTPAATYRRGDRLQSDQFPELDISLSEVFPPRH